MRRITPQLCAQLSCISLFLIFTAHSAGQIPSTPGMRQDIQNREWALNNLGKSSRTDTRAEEESRILRLTVKEDFRQLQIVNNDLMKRTFIQTPNDPDRLGTTNKEIRSSLSEIQKLAGRLRTNLRLPEVKSRKDDRLSDPSISSGLLILDQTIMKFVGNPIFQQPGVLDAQESTRAAEDLNKILRLTDSLRKLAQRSPK